MAKPATVNAVAVIEQGQSLSDAVDCLAGDVIMLLMPPAWSFANLTFQVSANGVDFVDLFERFGNQELMVGVVPNSGILVSAEFSRITKIKLRSGSRVQPIPQQGRREFTIVMQP